MNEKAYLKEIRKGNQEALNAFIETLYPSVYRYVFCKVAGKEEAKDITQEVFLRFIKQIHNYQSNGKVVNHKYYIEVIDHDSCSSVKFDLITKRFIFFEKRRIRKRVYMELNKSKLLLESMDFNLSCNEKLQFPVLKI